MMGKLLYLRGSLFGRVSWDWYSAESLHLFPFHGLFEGLQQGFRE